MNRTAWCRNQSRRKVAALVVLMLSLAAACGGGGGGSGSASTTGPNTDPDSEGVRTPFDPKNFVDPTRNTNDFFPIEPGTQWVYRGTTEVGQRKVPFEIITTMTDVIRVIDGVPTIAMLDEETDSGEVSQVSIDYMALDKDGNVWNLGGYTEDFEGGQYTNLENAWLGEADGQRVGILAPAKVAADTTRWFIAQAPDEKASVGQPVEVGIRRCVKFGCFDDVRVAQEGEVGAPDNEHKYYARGVGVIDNIPQDASLHQDTFELINLTRLDATGLAEASQTVLDLETHAHDTAPDVFGPTPTSTRGG